MPMRVYQIDLRRRIGRWRGLSEIRSHAGIDKRHSWEKGSRVIEDENNYFPRTYCC
jgi:hypothetical protein